MSDNAKVESPVSNSDLEAMSSEQLNALIVAAQTALSASRMRAGQALVSEMRERAAGLGLDIATLIPSAASRGPGRPRSKPATTRAPVPVKYRNGPDEAWTGRGRKPNWVVREEAGGRKLADFAVAA